MEGGDSTPKLVAKGQSDALYFVAQGGLVFHQGLTSALETFHGNCLAVDGWMDGWLDGWMDDFKGHHSPTRFLQYQRM